MPLSAAIAQTINNYLYRLHLARLSITNPLEDWLKYIQFEGTNAPIINQKEIRVVGLKRSGNHPIINWIIQQKRSKVWYLNNVKVNENPYRYKYQNLSYFNPQKYHKTKQKYWREFRQELTPKTCLIYSYEDYGLGRVFSDWFAQRHDFYVGKSGDCYDVIILRDPFNLLASRLKRNFLQTKEKQKDFITLWIEYAKEFCGETNYLTRNKTCINYNLWTAEVDYRRQIAQQLKLQFTDAGINQVHGCGGGSSFEARNYHGQAQKMNVSNRWKYYIDDLHYRRLLNNQELLYYAEKIFGQTQAIEQIKANLVHQ